MLFTIRTEEIDDDSWGESESDADDDNYRAPQLAAPVAPVFPMVFYPMIMPMPPPGYPYYQPGGSS